MNFDGLLLGALIASADPLISDGRVRKIARPSGNHLSLTVETRDSKFLIDLCAEPGRSSLVITAASSAGLASMLSGPREKGDDGFAMLLVKHLKGARLTGIRQLGWDKVAKLSTDKRDEAGTLHACDLYAELTGRNPNLILVDRPSGRILGALRCHSLGCPQDRPTIPGTLYRPPEPVGMNPELTSPEEFAEAVVKCGALDSGWKALQGVSASNWKQILTVASKAAESAEGLAGDGQTEPLGSTLSLAREFLLELHGGREVPMISLSPELGKIYLPTAGEPLFERHARLWLLEKSGRSSAERLKKASGSVSRARSRLSVRLSKMERELSECSMAGVYRLRGDLIMASLGMIGKGLSSARVPDHYNGGETEIPLDPRYLPLENAQRYYRRARKMDSRARHLGQIIAEVGRGLAFLDEIAYSLSMAGSEGDAVDDTLRALAEATASRGGDKSGFQVLGRNELLAILKELGASRDFILASGGLPNDRAESKGQVSGRKSPGRRGFSSDSAKGKEDEGTIALRKMTLIEGVEIFIGVSAVQNDFIVSRIAGREDLWFHAREVTGGHVLARPSGRGPFSEDEDVYGEIVSRCAGLAAWFSSVASSGRVEVQFTRRKHLRKAKGLFPGTVLVDREETLVVEPSEPAPGSVEIVRFTRRRPSASESRGEKRHSRQRPSR